MPEMSMKQAAEWAGVTKPTISKALRGELKGRSMSGRLDEKGQWWVEPGELARVFGPASSRHTSETASGFHPDTPAETPGHAREMALLREMVTKAERAADDLRGERDRLLVVIERQSLMLVDQRQTASGAAVITPPPPALPSARPGILARLKAVVLPP